MEGEKRKRYGGSEGDEAAALSEQKGWLGVRNLSLVRKRQGKAKKEGAW